MQPHNPERRFAAPFKQAPLKWLFDQCGGQTMFLLLFGFIIGLFFVPTAHIWKYLALYGATLGGQVARAVGEDATVGKAKILNGGVK